MGERLGMEGTLGLVPRRREPGGPPASVDLVNGLEDAMAASFMDLKECTQGRWTSWVISCCNPSGS